MHNSLVILSTYYSPGPGHSCHTSNTRYRLLKAHISSLVHTQSISHTPLASHSQHSSHTSSWSPKILITHQPTVIKSTPHTPAPGQKSYCSCTAITTPVLLVIHGLVDQQTHLHQHYLIFTHCTSTRSNTRTCTRKSRHRCTIAQMYLHT
jgi:hypothetical protein